jgi:hypothetical protein
MTSNQSFAALVHAALRDVGTAADERFGARKVFISALFRALARAGYDVGSLDSFKARLVDANRSGDLQLARADLVGAMPASAVRPSLIVSLGSEFHFVIDPGARDPWETAAA